MREDIYDACNKECKVLMSLKKRCCLCALYFSEIRSRFSIVESSYRFLTGIFLFFVLSLPLIIELILMLTHDTASFSDKKTAAIHFFYLELYSFLTSVLLIYFIRLLSFKKKVEAFFAVSIVIVCCSFSLINGLCLSFYQIPLSTSIVYAFFGAGNLEKISFVKEYITIREYLIFSLYGAFLVVYLRYCRKSVSFSLRLRNIGFIFFLISVFSSLILIYKAHNIHLVKQTVIGRVLSSYMSYVNELEQIDSGSLGRNSLLKGQSIFPDENEVHIVVIGESASKHHWQLYGYQRETTPALFALKNELITFNKVKTTDVHTVESLTSLFVKPVKNSKENLINGFNQAGFKTYWISNQEISGNNQSLVTGISKACSKSYFINYSGNQSLDEKTIPFVKKCIREKAKKKIIFVHLMGSHLSYFDRYPKSASTFKDPYKSLFGFKASQFVNHYDNSIRYTDQVLSQLISIVKNNRSSATLSYFSDHGDEVYDFRDFHGHAQHLKSRFMDEIPFCVFLNKKYRSKDTFMFHKLFKNQNRFFKIQDFLHTFHTITHSSSLFYDASKSMGVNLKEELISKQKPVLVSVNRPQIWCHRVNSSHRLKEVSPLFDGIEVDVMMNQGVLMAQHPPEQFSEPLAPLLLKAKKMNHRTVWLDLKNLKPDNQHAILKQLLLFRSKHPLLNLIIESDRCDLLPLFMGNKFMCSYYLPELSKISVSGLTEVKNNVIRYNPSFISQNYTEYELMKKHFPSTQKLIWVLNISYNKRYNNALNILFKQDPTLKSVLVNYPTPHWI